MKKNLAILFTCLLLPAALTGCFNKDKKTEPAVREPVEEPRGGLQVVENPTLLGWLYRGVSARCAVQASEGEVIIKTKNNKVRIEGLTYSFGENQTALPATSLTDNEWMYWWSGSEGVKIDLGALASIDEIEKTIQNKTWSEIAQVWQDEKTAFECQNADLPDSEFELPEDAEFRDISGNF